MGPCELLFERIALERDHAKGATGPGGGGTAPPGGGAPSLSGGPGGGSWGGGPPRRWSGLELDNNIIHYSLQQPSTSVAFDFKNLWETRARVSDN